MLMPGPNGGRISYDARNAASLDDYVHNVSLIWKRKRPPHLTLLRLVSHASEVCEEIRKGLWNDAIERLADVLIWWMTFVDQVTNQHTKRTGVDDLAPFIQLSASELVWIKFPHVCSNCLARWYQEEKGIDVRSPDLAKVEAAFEEGVAHHWNRPCTCAGFKEGLEGRPAEFKTFSKNMALCVALRARAKKPQSLHDMANMLKRLYKNNLAVYSTEEIAFHLLEEVGEVATAYTRLFMQPLVGVPAEAVKEDRLGRVANLAEELADVFAWSVMLLNKLHNHMNTAKGVVKLFQRQKEIQTLEPIFSEALGASENLVNLIWTLYGVHGLLACETCRNFECDENHERHSDTKGLVSHEEFEKRPELVAVFHEASRIGQLQERQERLLRDAMKQAVGSPIENRS